MAYSHDDRAQYYREVHNWKLNAWWYVQATAASAEEQETILQFLPPTEILTRARNMEI